ncbi:MAG: hypothetical protein AAFX65_05985 [Cyanobacteria bacterium J06638_7]
MAPTRLSDDQKQEIVLRYRGGASSTELAASYGCSANTVSRVVKAALAPADYEQLKRQRSRAASAPVQAPAPAPTQATPESLPPLRSEPGARLRAEAEGEHDDDDSPGMLAIDDADDFGDDDSDDSGDDDSDDEFDDGDGAAHTQEFVTVPVHLGEAVEERLPCRALSEAELPESAYLLVDRTVELQPTPLGECPDLGPLTEQEAGLQALLLFVNPRQAKRHCGRSQRVIKLPDVGLLERTAPYLLAQGISRVVIEGGVYSLPGS